MIEDAQSSVGRSNFSTQDLEVTSWRKYYKRPVIDRIFGSYTIEYTKSGEPIRERIHTRLTDLEGNRPSIRSILFVPKILLTYFLHHHNPILPRPLPFMSPDAVDFLSALVNRGVSILEIGGGNSTIWFLQNSVRLLTVETDPLWMSYVDTYINERKIVEKTGSVFDFLITRKEDVVKTVDNIQEKFDIALIDAEAGVNRVEVFSHVIPKIKEGGWICVDNTDSPLTRQARKVFNKYKRKQFVGYSYMSFMTVTQTGFWNILNT